MGIFLFLCFLQLYPTVVRSLGIGAANVFARFGAIITPFIAEVRL